MPSRRAFIKSAAGITAFSVLTGCQPSDRDTAPQNSEVDELSTDWFMCEESEFHERTWMAFGASEKIWGRDLIDEVRKNLATIAETIARYEPVMVCVRPDEMDLAKQYISDRTNIEFLECPLNDLWIRDYGAVYVVNEAGDKAAVDFNFSGWGEKQEFHHDARVAAKMAEASNVPLIRAEICLEGGGIEVDGSGTAIITESCVLNVNRNPDWSKKDCLDELRQHLGIKKILWLPGVRNADITDGHTDFYARFTRTSVVVIHLDPNPRSPDHKLTNRHMEMLNHATDAQGIRLSVVPIEAPLQVRKEFESDDFCAGYINFYLCNGAVIAPQFGDTRADDAAEETLRDMFPDREVVMLNIDGIAAGGGGIHCATQQEPQV